MAFEFLFVWPESASKVKVYGPLMCSEYGIAVELESFRKASIKKNFKGWRWRSARDRLVSLALA